MMRYATPSDVARSWRLWAAPSWSPTTNDRGSFIGVTALQVGVEPMVGQLLDGVVVDRFVLDGGVYYSRLSDRYLFVV